MHVETKITAFNDDHTPEFDVVLNVYKLDGSEATQTAADIVNAIVPALKQFDAVTGLPASTEIKVPLPQPTP